MLTTAEQEGQERMEMVVWDGECGSPGYAAMPQPLGSFNYPSLCANEKYLNFASVPNLIVYKDLQKS